jgi:methionyl-tRNA formyltransferase
LRISILSTDVQHPVIPYLQRWLVWAKDRGHEATLHHDKANLPGGDLLFLVSCTQIIGPSERQNFGKVLVLHASDLPHGRGWSPHIWSILEGENSFTVCLLEAAEPLDSGNIWLTARVRLGGVELIDEINQQLFEAELNLMSGAVEDFDTITPQPQSGSPSHYRRKRTPADSELDVNRSLAEQFDLLRVADPVRHPAFFRFRGRRYLLKIEKADDE